MLDWLGEWPLTPRSYTGVALTSRHHALHLCWDNKSSGGFYLSKQILFCFLHALELARSTLEVKVHMLLESFLFPMASPIGRQNLEVA